MHLRDEVEDLFPTLARRCTDEDSIASVLGRIRHDQDQALSLLPSVRGAIANCLDAGPGLFPAKTARFLRVLPLMSAAISWQKTLSSCPSPALG